jgi:hypothetical protein
MDWEVESEEGGGGWEIASEDPATPAPGALASVGKRYSGQLDTLKRAIGLGDAGGGRGMVNEQPGERAAYLRGQQPFRDKREAIDAAVNEIEVGVPAEAVFEQFGRAGVTRDEIMARGKTLGGKAFAPGVDQGLGTQPATGMPAPSDTMRADEPGTMQGIANFGRRVAERGGQIATGALSAANIIPPESAAAGLASSQKRLEAAAPGAKMQAGLEELSSAKTFGEAFSAIGRNPGATALVVGESLALFLPTLVAATVLAPGALGTAAMVGGTSAAIEFGNALTEELGNRGIDARDIGAVEKALGDNEFMDDVRKRGALRGLAVGTVDALSAGLAGKFFKPAMEQVGAGLMTVNQARLSMASAAAKEISLQGAMGSAGEALGGAAVGEFKPFDIAIEGLAGAATAPLEVAANVGAGGALARDAGSRMRVEDALITALETGQTRKPIIRVEDMPTTPLTPEQVASLAPARLSEATTGSPTVFGGASAPTVAGAPIPAGQASELGQPRPGALGAAALPQGSLADFAEQQLRARSGQSDVPVPAPMAGPAADAGGDQRGGSGAAVGRVADAGRAAMVQPGVPAPATGGVPAEPDGRAAGQPAALKAPRLQNRDRSEPAYIQQMQAIAANPDGDRLSVSRDFATGAPVVLADAIPVEQMGRQDRVTTSAGRKIPIRYAVVEAETLLPSNNADGSKNAGYVDGLPGRARVVAGNGRAAAMQLAYQMGTTKPYQQVITDDAGQHGVSAAVIASMNRPVLVRVMDAADVTADIGDESNVSGVADKSAKEAARDDARRVDLTTLDFNEDGSISDETMRQFVDRMPVSEQTALRNPDGSPTRQAQDRLAAAVFQMAYEDDALVGLYSQAIDPEARVVMAGIAAAAPQMMRLQGAGGLDIRPIVSQAAQMAINAKRRGIKLSDMAAQTDLDTDPDVAVVLRIFAANNRSAKKLGEVLRDMAQFAYDQAAAPTSDMFGDVPRATRAQVLERFDETRSAQGLENARGRQSAGSDVQRRPADARAANDGRADQADRPAEDQADLAAAPVAESFPTAGAAMVWAAQNRIPSKVEPAPVGGGFVLIPKVRPATAATIEADKAELSKLNAALRKAGWLTPAGKPVQVKPAAKPPTGFAQLAAAVEAAFGIRVLAISGAPGNGLQAGRRAYVDVTADTAELLIGVTGHEVKHWLEVNDKAAAEAFRRGVAKYLRADAVESQLRFENSALLPGEAPVDATRALSEVESNINGAMWLDPAFWGRLYEVDNGSTFRKVLYRFMQMAARLVNVTRGGQFDAEKYVTDIAAVREVAAQVWIERAQNRRGKAGADQLVKGARRGPSPLDQDLFAAPAVPQEAKPAAPPVAPQAAPAEDFNLSRPTPRQVVAQAQAAADETRAEAARRRIRDEQERKDRDRLDIAARMDSSAENFQLGQNAQDALSGQDTLFQSRRSRQPRSFVKKVKVTTDVFIEETGAFEQREIGSDAALKALDADITEMQRFIACLGG